MSTPIVTLIQSQPGSPELAAVLVRGVMIAYSDGIEPGTEDRPDSCGACILSVKEVDALAHLLAMAFGEKPRVVTLENVNENDTWVDVQDFLCWMGVADAEGAFSTDLGQGSDASRH
ncbi:MULTISPECIES: hypothetical protein [unclassified Thioalkalivibrio]|uniref:hypothetical protein n=1 Tax=unclassified Thioalkalivibrio TaxID=2621013 RepID=UPI00036ED454|nr:MULTISPECIES: hypothetical protein [unclassified Thioalkalivibrio]